MSTELKTCPICGWQWDPHPWTRCPRCVGRTTAYEPTGDEIRQACEAIRKTWSRAMKHQRCMYKTTPAETPVVARASGGRRRYTEGLT